MAENLPNQSIYQTFLAVEDSRRLAVLGRESAARGFNSKTVDDELVARSRRSIATSRGELNVGRKIDRKLIEFKHLKQANAHIANARLCIQRQERLIGELGRAGCRTEEAEVFLHTMFGTLKAMEGHRDLILDYLGL